MSKRSLLIILIIIFVVGAGLIVYYGRPVMQSNDTNSTSNPSSNTSGTDAISNEDLTYALSEVESHNTQESCWTAINGDVYDLTTWISRHPGGPDKIINLCGKESTQAFEGMHGNSDNAKNALALLKIGTLN